MDVSGNPLPGYSDPTACDGVLALENPNYRPVLAPYDEFLEGTPKELEGMVSGERQQVLAQRVRIAGELLVDFLVSALPGGEGLREQCASVVREDQDTAAPVGRVGRNLDQTAALQRFEGGGQRCPVHGEEGGDRPHRGRIGPVERHQERELPVGESEWAQGFVEATSQGAGGPLDVKTEAAIPDHNGCLVRKHVGT